ncbi:STAS domain-containing protein, partial [Yersinia enterocolitica]
LRKNGEFINNQGGAVLHHNSPIPWSTFAQYLTTVAMILFARRIAHVIYAERILSDDGKSVRYTVHGPLFFASSNDLFEHFDYAHDPKRVIIDLTHAQIWDASTVAALDGIEYRYQRYGAEVIIEGLDTRSSDFHSRLSGNLR